MVISDDIFTWNVLKVTEMREIFISKHPIKSFLIWGGITTYIAMISLRLHPPLLPSVVTVAGGVLITGFAAILAFQNMNKNEVKKQSREQYQAYGRYLGCLQQRFQCLVNIRKYFEPYMQEPLFIRGAQIPYIPLEFFYDEINFSELTFVGGGIPKVELLKDEGVDSKYNCINIAYMRQLEYVFKGFERAVNTRNDIHNEQVLPLLVKEYLGGGHFNLKIKSFSTSLQFYDFSQYLKLSEDILEMSDDLIREFELLLGKLSEFGGIVLDAGVVSENGGVPRFILRKGSDGMDLSIKYKPLSEFEKSRLYAKDYPNIPADYRQSGNW